MKHSHYKKFKSEDLILRDHLAIDRTMLANESTLLAYIRTSLAILISGISLIKFFTIVYLQLLGGIFVFFGILILFIGAYRFTYFNNDLKKIK